LRNNDVEDADDDKVKCVMLSRYYYIVMRPNNVNIMKQ